MTRHGNVTKHCPHISLVAFCLSKTSSTRKAVSIPQAFLLSCYSFILFLQLKDEEIPRAHWGPKHLWSLFMYVSEWLYKSVSAYSPNCYPTFPKTVWEGLYLITNSKPLLSIKHCFKRSLKLCFNSMKFLKHLHTEKILKKCRSRIIFVLNFCRRCTKTKIER